MPIENRYVLAQYNDALAAAIDTRASSLRRNINVRLTAYLPFVRNAWTAKSDARLPVVLTTDRGCKVVQCRA
jgi:hypothetical protein